MCFSLGQSSDCYAILRNLLETHTSFSAKRPADAKVGHLGEFLDINPLAFFLGQSSDCYAILRNLLKTHTGLYAGRPADAKERCFIRRSSCAGNICCGMPGELFRLLF